VIETCETFCETLILSIIEKTPLFSGKKAFLSMFCPYIGRNVNNLMLEIIPISCYDYCDYTQRKKCNPALRIGQAGPDATKRSKCNFLSASGLFISENGDIYEKTKN